MMVVLWEGVEVEVTVCTLDRVTVLVMVVVDVQKEVLSVARARAGRTARTMLKSFMSMVGIVVRSDISQEGQLS